MSSAPKGFLKPEKLFPWHMSVVIHVFYEKTVLQSILSGTVYMGNDPHSDKIKLIDAKKRD